MDTISFKDFEKLDIRVGTIVLAERIEGADKLLKLMINFGDEERQVLAGIAEFVEDPSTLLGKQIPVLTNLEPRKMRGLDSNGMILVAHKDGAPIFLVPETEVLPGSTVS